MSVGTDYHYSVITNSEDGENMQSNFKKFQLLMWKNWKLHRRRPWVACLEIFSPVILSMLLVLLRSLVDIENNPPVLFTPFCPTPLPLTNSSICDSLNFNAMDNEVNDTRGIAFLKAGKRMIVYSPRNYVIDNAMKMYSSILAVKGYNSSTELVNHFSMNSSEFTIAGIQFDDDLLDKDTIPKDLKVKIRFPSELRVAKKLIGIPNWVTFALYPLYQTTGPREPGNNTGAQPSYYREGFLALQQTLTYSLILSQQDILNNMTTWNPFMLRNFPIIQMQRFPHAAYTTDPLLQALEAFVGLLFLLSFTYPCMNNVKMIIYEKERMLKETMKIMGLSNWSHWMAWFAQSLIMMTISVILSLILQTVPWFPDSSYSVFTKSNRLVLFLFMMIYVCATITFCFAISVFFSKANTASALAAVIFFLTYVPYMFLRRQYATLSLTVKLVSSIMLNTAMSYGFQIVLMFEEKGEGIQWHNINKTVTLDDDLTLGHLMLMLLIDGMIYLFIALYFEAIFPGDIGVGKPWYFLCTGSFWCGDPKTVAVEALENGFVRSENADYFEPEPRHLQAGIQIKNLHKKFANNVAVKNLSLNMYEGQITVLLGHNGAGKTTTMSMLTGIMPPTSGTAIINGYDIKTSMKQVRSSLGLCPQHDILFDDLTVKEHLVFFSKLKGLEGQEINREVEKYLELLDLVPKANNYSKTLSGGMKRKLCICMAFCGNSKIVMLDEPTAGIDPTARRSVWALIQSQKEGRTVLLTTHFMDEADLLGDRIAIMATGDLKCCGSSFFLKKKYGAGYRLIIDKESGHRSKNITQELSRYMPEIKIESSAGTKVTYILGDVKSQMFDMLQGLEKDGKHFGVKSYGISLSTLEEVFLKVGADPKVDSPTHVFLKASSSTSVAPISGVSSDLLTGWYLLKNQILAMLMKKVLIITRSWVLFAIAVFMPVIFLIVSVLQARTRVAAELPPREFTLNPYGDTRTVLEDLTPNNYSSYYHDLLKEQRHKLHVTSNVTSLMLNLTAKYPLTVRQRYIVGASFGTTNIQYSMFTQKFALIKAWFNNDPYHSPGLALQLVLNAVYKEKLGDDYNIRFVNHPLPYKVKTQIENALSANGPGFQIAFNIGFAMSFVATIFLLFYIRERASKSKHLQFVCGINALIFWFTSYICDILVFVVITFAMMITLLALQEDGFKTGSDLVRIFIIMQYFSFCVLPLMYLASFLFSVPSTGYVRISLFAFIFGSTAFLVVTVLSDPYLELRHIADILHWVFLPIPFFSLCSGITRAYITYAAFKGCNDIVDKCIEMANFDRQECLKKVCMAIPEYCCDIRTDYYKWQSPGIGSNIVISGIVAASLFTVLFLVEYRMFHKILYAWERLRYKPVREDQEEDSDVAQERLKIRSTPTSDLISQHSLVLKNLTKRYKDVVAVNNLCLGVKGRECFGLLGINGAGKTTTFKILTGDIRMTDGDAWVDGLDVATNMKQVQRHIGYCPQFDAMLDNMTAKETLIMYSLIRGVPFSECSALAVKLSKEFDFQQHLYKQVGRLSGGNKRKLSTAISLIGDPKVIYLDEPTTGMDPATKRYLWNKLTEVFASGKCLVLTSHSMEECEALCTRVAIMVNGKFKCLGSIQHLKNKFSKGCTLTIKVQKGAETEPIESYIKATFPLSKLTEKHQELMSFYITDKMSWPQMFSIVENAKSEFSIEDYSLSQTSLEQVFLSFTKEGADDTS